MSCFLTVFSTPCTQNCASSCRTRAPPSLPGLWCRESLLRILAPLHHNTHDVSTIHTHFFLPQQLLKPFGHACHQTCTTRCTRAPGPDPWVPPARHPAHPAKPLAVFSLPPDLKIAGNSIFILLCKNFFLSYTAPLPNFRTSRGVPAPSSPASWAAARMEK